MIDLARLHHVVALARIGSFSRASEDLGITQSALSRSIAAFERHHRIRLFDRRRDGVVPTGAGRVMVERAKAILDIADGLAGELEAHGTSMAGDVSIGMGPMIASLVLPRLGAALFNGESGLRITASIKSGPDLFADLAADKLDFVLASPSHMQAALDFDVQIVATLPLVAMVRAGHPLAARETVAMAELSAWPFAYQQGPWQSSLRGVVCDNYHILREIVLTSSCYWFIPACFVADDVAQGRLVALPISDIGPQSFDMAVIRRRRRRLSRAALLVAEESEHLLRGFANFSPYQEEASCDAST
ncbi:DNA-binding transcriptional LysR family regulator [Sphingobium sp. OAS761]|uniref:LysR family transcriptional regulator n=1 Tax=Sphingobium sp. OAS761 TaxID=2817901 RepID=UPI0020A1189A|nr:LysR family transcriptional regulator [Sphingobium sp. OAS761]MCP1471712.1 DNA-binding transcriptional LysR family regulator [Sphingobium sp. OAS761]